MARFCLKLRSDHFLAQPFQCFIHRISYHLMPCSLSYWQSLNKSLTLNPLTWRIWWAPNNASRWQIGFNLEFKGLKAEPLNCNPKVQHISTQTLATTTCPQPAAQTSYLAFLTTALRDGRAIAQAIIFWSVAAEVRDIYQTVHVGFEVDKVEREQFLLTVLR